MVSLVNDHSLKYIGTSQDDTIAEQLYNLATDPGEQFDLASPATELILRDFRRRLTDYATVR